MNNLRPLNLQKKKPKVKMLLGVAVILVGMLLWARSSSPSAFNYVFGGQSTLKVVNGKVNVLLLGIAGGKHDGPNLTDTIIVASYDTKTKKVDLISLPRDLWLTKHQVKVNALYPLGINKGNGLDFTKQEIGDILGLEIPYAVRVDFGGFTKAVDLVGGLDIDVAQSFDDYVYPIPGKEDELCGYKEGERELAEEQAKALGFEPGKFKVLLDKEDKIATMAAKPQANLEYTDNQVIQFFSCRFEHLSFKQGITHMNGETALKYVRSRHGNNNEGTDFARSKRQQLVIQSFKAQVLSLDTLTNLGKMIDLIKVLGASIETNISQDQYLEFAGLVRKMDGVKSHVINESGEKPLLVTPPQQEFGGAWVLIPPKNDFNIIHEYVAGILSGNLTASGSAKQK